MSKITNLEQELYLEELLLAHPREENSGERPALLLTETWAVVLCVHMDELPELEALMAARRALRQTLRTVLEGPETALRMAGWMNDLLVAVLRGPREQLEPALLRPKLMEVVQRLEPVHACYIAVSGLCGDQADLREHYMQVSSMIDYGVLTEKRVFFAQELPEPHYDRSCRVLKGRLEKSYMEAITAKEFLVAFHCLEKIVTQELDEDIRAVRRLKHRLLARVENAMQLMGVAADDPNEQSPCRELFGQAARQNSVRGLLACTKAIYELLDREASRPAAEQNKPEEVLRFLEEHYTDPALDSAMAAEACAVSKAYLSRIVNRYGGSSFSDYVGALRIGAAKELLKTTALTVDEIGTRVGYTNRWTMLRAFKRFVGMTPQAYREYAAGRSL